MGDDPILWQILLQIALIMLNAVFACAEIAIISIKDVKLEKMAADGDKRAKRLVELTKQPSNFLATIQIGITLAGFLGSAFAADNFSAKLVGWFISVGVPLPASTLATISVILITLILSYFTLILGELVPKRIAMKKAEAIGLGLSGPIYVLSKAFTPVVWFLTASTNIMLKLFDIDPNENNSEVTEEEIRMMIDVGTEKGTIDEDEKEFIHNVFELNDKTAGEVMTHRTEVSFLWLEESGEKWEEIISQSRHTHYPVCGDDTDEIVGILNIKDYYALKDKSREEVLKKAVHPPQFIPEMLKNDVLFKKMKISRNHFAIVVDEYGGVGGVITISDLLEELVGDLEDDLTLPPEDPMIETIDTNTWKIRGIAPLDDVAEALATPLPQDDYDTFGGMVFSLMGSIPPDGSTPELEEFGLLIKVLEIKDHRLEKALVTRTEKEAEKTEQ